MNRDPLDPGLGDLELTGVQAGADLEVELPDRVPDCTRTADRPRGPVEGGEESVAGDPDLLAAEPLQMVSDERVMLVEECCPAPVAELGGPLGGADDVGEEHGCENAMGSLSRREPVRNSSASSTVASAPSWNGRWLLPSSSMYFAFGMCSAR